MKPVVLCILDGWGLRKEDYGNAINQANKPNFDFLWNKYSHSILEASRKAVGLPEDGLGGSEVGHLNMAAGRIVYQPFQLINHAIETRDFFKNKVLLEVLEHVKKNNSKLHLYGIPTDGTIHSHISHLFALLDMIKENGITNVYLHYVSDGRDTPIDSSPKYMKMVFDKFEEVGFGKIATVAGRYYPMDRDRKWDRVKLGYDAMVNGIGEEANSALEAVEQSYAKGVTDEFILPTVVDKNGLIEDNDGFIDFNFRKDREVEMMTALTNPEFNDFETKKINNLKIASFMYISESVESPYAFKAEKVVNGLGDWLSINHKTQLRIAETEKYVYVTSVFDGMEEKKIEGRDEVLIPSPKVPTFDLKPEMSAYEITDKLFSLLDEDKYDVVILNYANPDMVGHTGMLEPAIRAIEAVDDNLGKLYKKIKDINGMLVVTADHGNADIMLDENGEPMTAHTMNPVPFIICDEKYKLKEHGIMSDVAPTLLDIMGIEKPKEMLEESLIIK